MIFITVRTTHRCNRLASLYYWYTLTYPWRAVTIYLPCNIKKGRKCHAVQEELSVLKVAKMQQGSTLLEIVTNVTTNMQQSTNKSQKHSLPKKWMGKGSVSPIVLSSKNEDTDMGELGDVEIQRRREIQARTVFEVRERKPKARAISFQKCRHQAEAEAVSCSY